jgi:hypothetical protein
MPYVKISDPQVIDLAAWHQVINVVNQHSDSISSITNNMGGTSPELIDFNGENNFVNVFDPGAQKMLYGRTKLNTSDMSPVADTYEQIYYGTIDFAENGQTVFGARPIVTATIQFGHASIAALAEKNYDLIFNIFAVTPERFSYRINRAIAEPDEANEDKRTPKIPANNTFYLNWSATGPK